MSCWSAHVHQILPHELVAAALCLQRQQCQVQSCKTAHLHRRPEHLLACNLLLYQMLDPVLTCAVLFPVALPALAAVAEGLDCQQYQ